MQLRVSTALAHHPWPSTPQVLVFNGAGALACDLTSNTVVTPYGGVSPFSGMSCRDLGPSTCQVVQAKTYAVAAPPPALTFGKGKGLFGRRLAGADKATAKTARAWRSASTGQKFFFPLMVPQPLTVAAASSAVSGGNYATCKWAVCKTAPSAGMGMAAASSAAGASAAMGGAGGMGAMSSMGDMSSMAAMGVMG